jgi:hypothetical protein
LDKVIATRKTQESAAPEAPKPAAGNGEQLIDKLKDVLGE